VPATIAVRTQPSCEAEGRLAVVAPAMRLDRGLRSVTPSPPATGVGRDQYVQRKP
jgi:hypothetical protein